MLAIWLNSVSKKIDVESISSLMRQGFAKALKLEGKHQVLAVEGADGVVTHYQSQELSIQIRTASGHIHVLKGSIMPTVASATPVTDWPVLIHRWPHLSDLLAKKLVDELACLSDWTMVNPLQQSSLGQEEGKKQLYNLLPSAGSSEEYWDELETRSFSFAYHFQLSAFWKIWSGKWRGSATQKISERSVSHQDYQKKIK